MFRGNKKLMPPVTQEGNTKEYLFPENWILKISAEARDNGWAKVRSKISCSKGVTRARVQDADTALASPYGCGR